MPNPKLTDNALTVLEKRYFCKDEEGNLEEDWSGLCKRVARSIALAEAEDDRTSWEYTFFEMMHELQFLPNSPTLFNAGRELGNLSACYVLPIGDSLSDIFNTLHNAVLIFASGGGCGYDFSQLRKKGSPVSRTNGVSSGPISFIQAYNSSTEVIKQGGKRRGANMGVLRVDHPDIEEFIDAKTEEGALANFNLSIAITDEFMEVVSTCYGKDVGPELAQFELYDHHLDKVDRVVNALELFNRIVERTWSNGEPGVLFIDTINKKHTLQGLGKITGVNPCGEQPLLPNESCNLGSINLTKYYSGNSKGVAWEKLARMVSDAVRFLDDVIQVNKYPIAEIEEASLKTRKIGLGIMGWADLLLACGIRYDSEDAYVLAEKLMEFIQYHALKTSCQLAKEREPFPACDKLLRPKRPTSVWTKQSLDWDTLDRDIADFGLRNGCVTTIAPTGTLSLIAGVSSGIEPNFEWEYQYHRVGEEFTEIHALAKPYILARETLPEYFVTASGIRPKRHVEMQAIFQRWIDAGISKTINLPYDATKEDVAEAILLAWRLGCKGTTLYRSGSRTKEVLVAKDTGPKISGPRELPPIGRAPRERPRKTSGETLRIPVGDDCGHLFVTVNFDEQGPCESFIVLGKGGGCIHSHIEALGRLVSLALRGGMDYTEIVNQLAGIRCSKGRWVDGIAIRSCADAVAHAIEELVTGEDTIITSTHGADQAPADNVVKYGENPECPECRSMLIMQEGCLHCRCGYSKCV